MLSTVARFEKVLLSDRLFEWYATSFNFKTQILRVASTFRATNFLNDHIEVDGFILQRKSVGMVVELVGALLMVVVIARSNCMIVALLHRLASHFTAISPLRRTGC